MKNIKLTIEYDGSRYAGWQRQENAMTVQQKLEEVLEKLCSKPVNLIGSGRTDSGVHARGQVANFKTNSTIPPQRFSYALNSMLPCDIRINHSEEVIMDFHARFSATGKKYRYSIINNTHGTAIGWQYLYHVNLLLDLDAMSQAAKVFKGTHDYAAFMATGSPVRSTVRTIYESKLIQEESLLHFIVTGNGFLYNMVRIMAGTLIDVGKGKISANEIPDIIASKERGKAGATAPANGLFLEEVYYD
ncbi:MAG: tRNA pseudouridine(38-40) synthase TruA [Clostridiales bacterium]|nr:tRNA pseudouridine(38-40) synthase TruA [Clostridiales bacterium]